MKTSLASDRRAAWLRAKFSLTVVLALLQRTPAVRLVQSLNQLVSVSPAGAMLKSVFTAVFALGAVDSMAGATTLVASRPSPLTLTEGQAVTPIAFTVTDTINLGSWKIGGTFPPGMRFISSQGTAQLSAPGTLDATTPGSGGASDDPYATPGDSGNTMTLPVLTGTPTQAGSYTITLQAYQLGGLTGFNTAVFNYVVNVAAATQPSTRPTFNTQPAAQTVTAGGNVTFTSAASGTPAPTYQWSKDDTALAGATSATLTLTAVQTSDAGVYTVTATNSAGNVVSNNAALTVTPVSTGNTAPAIARQPQSQRIASGTTVAFSADATGSGLNYAWSKNGAPIPGATRATLVLNAAGAADAGAYAVAVSNSVGAITSSAATLTVVTERNFGHLVNLSIRTSLTAADPSFTVGTVVGGAGTSGPKPMLIRAVGPSLAAFGLTGALLDSQLDILAGNTTVASNNDWAGTTTLSAAFTQVGAFPFTSAASKDAAIFNASFAPRDYTVQVSGVGGATGEVLAELYDASDAGTFGPTTPRLVNVSVRKQIDAGANLTAGFVIGGNTARTVLIRAIGPGLTAFGVGGAMVDPQLTLFTGANKIAENDNWGGDAQLTTVGSSVGAFAIANAAGKDAMLLITLPPDSYTVEVRGVTGTAGGSVLVEVYEVP